MFVDRMDIQVADGFLRWTDADTEAELADHGLYRDRSQYGLEQPQLVVVLITNP